MEFSTQALREACAQLAEVLAPRIPTLEALARVLAPEDGAVGARFQEYGDSLASPRRWVPWAERLASPDALLALLADGDPGAVILALGG